MRTNLWENVSCKGGKGSFFVGSNKTGISKKGEKMGGYYVIMAAADIIKVEQHIRSGEKTNFGPTSKV